MWDRCVRLAVGSPASRFVSVSLPVKLIVQTAASVISRKECRNERAAGTEYTGTREPTHRAQALGEDTEWESGTHRDLLLCGLSLRHCN